MPGKKSKTNKQLWQPSFVGNTILLKLSEKQYIYIGGEIYRFDVITGDKITAFFSDVGNNDVPYPYAVGEKYIYILMEYAVAIEKSWFNMKESIYDQYYLPYNVHDSKHRQAVEEKFNSLKKYTRKLKKKLIKKRKF